jgi:benzoylformate decarboxylase
MRGRKVFMDTLVAQGVRHIFGNPGTTESPLIDSLIEYPQLSYVMALHEGVALGAASFYAQATGRTPVVNVHVAPGLGNALGAMYSALKANSPMVVTAGQQDTRMRLREPLLGHDLAAMAAPVAKWSVQVERADEMAPLLRRAFKVASDAPSGPVFVSLPIDVMEQETAVGALPADRLWRAPTPDPAGVAEIVGLLAGSRSPAIVSGDDVARSGAHEALVALAETIGAPVWFEGLHHHASFPSAHPSCRQSLPFDTAGMRKTFEGADVVLLLGGPFFEEVWFAEGSPFPDGTAVVQVEESPQRLAFNYPLRAGVVGGLKTTLEAVVAGLAKAPAEFKSAAQRRNAALKALKVSEAATYKARTEKGWNREPISMPRVMAEIKAGVPENVVIVDESITANQDLSRTLEFGGPGDYFSGRGGGIGQGLAGALGVKVAYPDRPVVAISGDGSAMYSIQALWTAAHHDLAIVFVILANREYRVLKHNIDAWRQRFEVQSNHPYQNMDLIHPNLGFVEMAQGMGVDGTRVGKAADVAPALRAAIASGKPHVIEIAIEGKR